MILGTLLGTAMNCCTLHASSTNRIEIWIPSGHNNRKPIPLTLKNQLPNCYRNWKNLLSHVPDKEALSQCRNNTYICRGFGNLLPQWQYQSLTNLELWRYNLASTWRSASSTGAAWCTSGTATSLTLKDFSHQSFLPIHASMEFSGTPRMECLAGQPDIWDGAPIEIYAVGRNP